MMKHRPSPPSPLPQAGEGRSLPRPACGERAGERGLLGNAKQLRSNQTDAEQKLWYHLRAHRFIGLKFKRQNPVGRYIADFVCIEQRLIIELDGGQHAEQHEYDTTRDAWLRSEGFTVLRFWNNEVMQEMEAVLEKIRLTLSPDPSPASGRGEQDTPLAPLAGRGPGRGE
jgi:very-short-patch-repair endonuclease